MTTLSIGYCSQPTVTQHLNRQNKWSQSWTSRKVNVVDAVIECEDEKSLKGYASCVALGVWTRAAPASTPSLPSPLPPTGLKWVFGEASSERERASRLPPTQSPGLGPRRRMGARSASPNRVPPRGWWRRYTVSMKMHRWHMVTSNQRPYEVLQWDTFSICCMLPNTSEEALRRLFCLRVEDTKADKL